MNAQPEYITLSQERKLFRTNKSKLINQGHSEPAMPFLMNFERRNTVTKKQIRHFEEAKREALKSDFRTRIGCIIILGNRVLAKGHNSNKTHPGQEKYNSYRAFTNQPNASAKVHAEIAALAKCKNANVDWSKVEIYIWRETKDERWCANSSPCSACRAAIRERGIRKIFYTGDNCLTYEFYCERSL